MRVSWFLLIAMPVVAPYNAVSAAAPRVQLASPGKALHPIVTADTASPRTHAAAERLGEYLSQISGAG